MSKSQPIVFLYLGGDSYQRKLAVHTLQKERFGDDEVEITRFDTEAGEIPHAIDEVVSYSLFSSSKLVVLESVEQAGKDHLELLSAYIQHPRGDTPLLMFAPIEKELTKVKEKETLKKIQKIVSKSQVKVLPKTSAAQIRKLILDKCKKLKITFEENAMNFFMESCAKEVEVVQKELEKLLIWADDDKTITLEACQRLVINEEEESVWAITNAAAEKNASLALRAVEKLLNQEDDEISITGRLIRTFVDMYRYKSLEIDKIPASEIGGKMGMVGFRLEQVQKHTKKFTLDELRQSISALRKVDSDLKGGRNIGAPILRKMVLERLILDLCNAQSSR